MTHAQFTDPSFANDVIGLIQSERMKSVSRREWLHRLKGFGLVVDSGTVFTMRNRQTVCDLPAALCE
jgi:hypothetical protein